MDVKLSVHNFAIEKMYELVSVQLCFTGVSWGTAGSHYSVKGKNAELQISCTHSPSPHCSVHSLMPSCQAD